MIERISLPEKEIILVGTAHISEESVLLVKQTIENENPDLVCVELDDERLHQLMNQEQWQNLDVTAAIKEGKTYLLLFNILLASMQQKLGKDIGIKPGAEMKEAILIASSMNIPIALLDRSVKITLKRAMSKMSLVEKAKLLYAIIGGMFGFSEEKIDKQRIEEMKKKDTVSELINELSRQMPSVKEVLVDERDYYISDKILNSTAKKIVCILGAGHLQGIKNILTNKEQKKIMIKELEKMPKSPNYMKILKYSIPALFLIFILYAFFAKGFDVTLNILLIWFIAHGLLAAIGALIARAHWKSIAVSFLAAPFTALHPALAVGWFSGLMEAKIKAPQIKDFETLRNISSYADLNDNRITHILLVTAYSNIGGTIGTIIALPYAAALLA